MWRLVLLAVFCVIVLLLFLRLRLVMVYESELRIFIRVLCFRFTLYPKKHKLRIKDFSAKGIVKKLKKDKIKAQAERRKEAKKNSPPGDKKDIGEPLEVLVTVRDVLLAIKERFLRYLRIHVAKLHLTLASDDAAKTAIEYGVAVQLIQYIVTILESFTNLHAENNMSVHVGCDFCTETSVLSLDITASLRIWQMITVLLYAAAAYLRATGKTNVKKKQ